MLPSLDEEEPALDEEKVFAPLPPCPLDLAVVTWSEAPDVPATACCVEEEEEGEEEEGLAAPGSGNWRGGCVGMGCWSGGGDRVEWLGAEYIAGCTAVRRWATSHEPRAKTSKGGDRRWDSSWQSKRRRRWATAA